MLSNKDITLSLVENIMNEGLICIDHKGIIQFYSEKAKEIFGIKTNGSIEHPPGELVPGDLVLICDYGFYEDDGYLTLDDLNTLGIQTSSIHRGQLVMAVGVYKSYEHAPFLRVHHPSREKTYHYNLIYLGLRVTLEIDCKNRLLTIQINDDLYTMSYVNSMGHIVVIDGKTMQLKFCQDNGYTAREESISDLLRGKGFRGKGPNYEDFEVVGKSLSAIHHSESMIDKFLNTALGTEEPFTDKFEIINGVPTICSSYYILEGETITGAALKVEDISKVRKVIEERNTLIGKLEEANRQLQDRSILDSSFPQLVGSSNAIIEIKKLALKAAESDLAVFISGESGTGKSLLASLIHQASPRNKHPFIHTYCSGRSESELHDELFGTTKTPGVIEKVQDGTLFLDEIEFLTEAIQSKLFRILEEKQIKSANGKMIPLKLRLIVATKKNLEKEILAGRFRDDLYYKLHVLPIWMPPLKDRKEDIRDLTQEFLKNFPEKQMTTEALNLLQKYDWPGNIRELENIITRCAYLSTDSLIFSEDLSIQLYPISEVDETHKTFKEYMEDKEQEIIELTLYKTKGDKKKAIETLEMSKTAFYEKLRRYNIKVK